MADKKRKPSTHADTMSAEEDYRTKYKTTDERARLMGYPNAELYAMDGRLAELADLYNETRDPEVLKKYEALYNKMLEMGMTPLMFSASTEIFREEYVESPSD